MGAIRPLAVSGSVLLVAAWSGCLADARIDGDTGPAGPGAHPVDMAAQPGDLAWARKSSLFDAPRDFPVDNPWWLAVGDFNGDQKLDLVTANNNMKVGVLLGDGNGGFGPSSYLPIRSHPRSVAVGDFNLDQKLDIAVTVWSMERSSVSIFLGDGRGGFAAATDFPADYGAWSVVVGDFDRDLKPDLAVAIANRAVDVLLGDGRGGFGPARAFPVGDGQLEAAWVVASDFNLDGIQDLAASTRSKDASGVSVLTGDGRGGFTAGTNISMAGEYGLAVGDFNLDGKPDLAGTSAPGVPKYQVGIALGDGRGGFGPVANFSVGAGTGYGLAVGDFDQDSRPDLAVSSILRDANVNQFSLLLGNGLGDFSESITMTVGSLAFSLAVADFNSDKRSDLAVVDWPENKVHVLLGLGRPAPIP